MELTLSQICEEGFQTLVCSFKSRWYTFPRKQPLIWNNKNQLDVFGTQCTGTYDGEPGESWDGTGPIETSHFTGRGQMVGQAGGEAPLGAVLSCWISPCWGEVKAKLTNVHSETYWNVLYGQPGTITIVLNPTLATPNITSLYPTIFKKKLPNCSLRRLILFKGGGGGWGKEPLQN